MKNIAMIAGAALICLPTAVFAQTAGAAPGIPPAPIGHLQPKPATPPDAQNKDSSGVSDRDDPAQLDKRLEPSTDKAIHSLCSYCLKPQKDKKQR